MTDTIELIKYLTKLKKIINTPDMSLFGMQIVKKQRIDDILVCIIASLPDSYKLALKRRVSIEEYPSIVSYNQLSNIIRKPFFFSKDYYIFRLGEVTTFVTSITKNIERDIRKLEEE